MYYVIMYHAMLRNKIHSLVLPYYHGSMEQGLFVYVIMLNVPLVPGTMVCISMYR
jgi:hypothetical protein